METIIIAFSDSQIRLHDLTGALSRIGKVSNSGDVLTLTTDESVAYIVHVRDVAAEGLFDDWPESLIPENPDATFSLDYRDPNLAEVIIRQLSGLSGCIIDTNRGAIINASIFESGFLGA